MIAAPRGAVIPVAFERDWIDYALATGTVFSVLLAAIALVYAHRSLKSADAADRNAARSAAAAERSVTPAGTRCKQRRRR